MSRVDLHLIADNDMYNFVENSISGGIYMISTRHAQSNNPSFPATYDANLPGLVSYLYTETAQKCINCKKNPIHISFSVVLVHFWAATIAF